MGRRDGLTAEKIGAVHDWRSSDAFSERERLVLELADAMTATPATVSDELFARLRAAFAPEELVELASAIAWENYRSRWNRVFDVAAEGYSEGGLATA